MPKQIGITETYDPCFVPDCLKGTWLFDEAKTLCDEGIAYMDRLFK